MVQSVGTKLAGRQPGTDVPGREPDLPPWMESALYLRCPYVSVLPYEGVLHPLTLLGQLQVLMSEGGKCVTKTMLK